MTSAGSIGLYVGLVVLAVVAFAGTVFYFASTTRRKNGPSRGQLSTITGESTRVFDIRPIKQKPVYEPRYANSYIPGSNMRVARQDNNGSWSFLNPQNESPPSALSDFDIEAQRRKFAGAARYAVEASRPMGTISPPPPSYSQIERSPLAWA